MDDKKFDEWLAESAAVAAKVKAKVGDSDIAVYNTVLDKAIRPFYFFLQDGGKGAQTNVEKFDTVKVSISDGPDYKTDEQAKTYTFRRELRDAGLVFDKPAYSWNGPIPKDKAEALKAKYTKLKVTIG